MFMQGLCYEHKPLDESPIVPHQVQKGSDFHVSSGLSELCHSFQVLFAGPHLLFGDMMSQIVNLILEEFALCGFKLSGCVPRSNWKQHASMACAPPLSSKRLSCHPNRSSSMSSSVPLGSSALTSEMWLVHCTAGMAHVHIWKILCFPQWKQCTASMPCSLQFAKNPPSGLSRKSIPLPLGFQWLLVSGKQIGVFLGYGIYLIKVNANVQTSVFLGPQYDCVTLWALTGADCTHFQHLLHMCLDLIHHGLGNPSEPLFKRFIINNSDFMFCQVSTA